MKNYFTLLMIVLVNVVFAQKVEIKIVSKHDQNPIPYVKVGIENSDKGFMANQEGEALYDFSSLDKNAYLIVDAIGYEKFIVKISEFIESNHIIELSPDIINLQETVIYNRKKFKEKNFGPKSKSKNVFFNIAPNDSEEKESLKEIAVFINSGSKRAKILRVNINFSKYEYDIELPFRIVIYKNNLGIPGEVINVNDILGNFSKEKIIDQVFTIDLEEYDLWIDESFYVGIQLLDNELKESVNLSASVLHKSFYRFYYNDWRKTQLSLSPAINVDVLISK